MAEPGFKTQSITSRTPALILLISTFLAKNNVKSLGIFRIFELKKFLFNNHNKPVGWILLFQFLARKVEISKIRAGVLEVIDWVLNPGSATN